MRYVAVVDGKAGAYGVRFADAPGCTAMGSTVDEALKNAAEALSEWIADELSSGRAPPRGWSIVEVRGAVTGQPE